jgi:hypothetical protein
MNIETEEVIAVSSKNENFKVYHMCLVLFLFIISNFNWGSEKKLKKNIFLNYSSGGGGSLPTNRVSKSISPNTH